MDLLIKALCLHGQIPLKPSSSMPKLDYVSNRLWEPQPDPKQAERASAKVIESTSSPPLPCKAEVSFEPQVLQRCLENTASAPRDPPHPISCTQRKTLRHKKPNANSAESLTPMKPKRSTRPFDRHQNRVAIDQLNYDIKASSNNPDIVDDDDDEDEDEDEDNNQTGTDQTGKDGTDSRSVTSEESADTSQDDYYDKALDDSAASSTIAPSRQTRQVTITLHDRRARSKLQTLKRSRILKLIQQSIQQQDLHVKVTRCERHIGRRANFWVLAKSREGARVLKKEWDVGSVEVFGRGAYMRESDGFVGMI